ncbi:hypothetical protein GJ496_003947 [Pomphorhynchus laevis]|nr:hypothetical protein GJ496_003947 [Pomphorhynchus laevis]
MIKIEPVRIWFAAKKLRFYRLIFNSEVVYPTNKCIKFLYLSKNYLVVDKQARVSVTKDQERSRYTCLWDQLEYKWPTFVNSLWLCHRIDAVTSGCLLLARNPQALLNAKLQFQQRKVHKIYLAIVRGYISENYIVIKKRIGRDTT